MELKKTPQADLQRRYPLHLALGFVISIALVISAFEWSTWRPVPVIDPGLDEQTDVIFDNDLLPPVKEFHKPPPKPKPPKKALVAVSNPQIVEAVAQIMPPKPVVYRDIEIAEIPEEQVDVHTPETVDQQAVPQGGWEAFNKFLQQHLKYPRPARQRGIEGIVHVLFVVDRSGAITEVKVLKGIGFGCDEEAIRVISLLPDWSPARRSGIRVPVRMVIPIHFKLN